MMGGFIENWNGFIEKALKFIENWGGDSSKRRVGRFIEKWGEFIEK
jgi:hypothetical protein